MLFKTQSFIQSLRFAYQGLQVLWQTERNFRIDLCLLSMVVLLGFLLHLSSLEWLFLVLISTVVLVTETLNTVIERLADWITGEAFSVQAKTIKDMSATACLLAALGAFVGGVVLFLPKLLRLF